MNLELQRESNKFSLITFGLRDDNRFEYAANVAIKKLMEENANARSAYKALEKIKTENRTKWNELEDKAEKEGHDLTGEFNSYMADIIYREEEMIAFMEMKIIYAYKHAEINIKTLIGASYPGTETRSFYNWENLIAFIKSKSIDPKSLDGYNDLVQLKDANNAAKHKGNIHEDMQHVPEFKGRNYQSYETLKVFYSRVKNAPRKFIEALSGAIYTELYEFDELKLEALASSLVLRLEKQQGLRLAELIRSHY